jgi:hypothetical protein
VGAVFGGGWGLFYRFSISKSPFACRFCVAFRGFSVWFEGANRTGGGGLCFVGWFAYQKRVQDSTNAHTIQGANRGFMRLIWRFLARLGIDSGGLWLCGCGCCCIRGKHNKQERETEILPIFCFIRSFNRLYLAL